MRRALALAAVTLAASGCASAPPASDRGDLVRRILTSTVQLRTEREGGARRAASGVVVAADAAAQRAWIVTARHFVHPPRRQQVTVRLPGRRSSVNASIAFVSLREVDAFAVFGFVFIDNGVAFVVARFAD